MGATDDVKSLASELGVSASTVWGWKKRGAPISDGVEAVSAWIAERDRARRLDGKTGRPFGASRRKRSPSPAAAAAKTAARGKPAAKQRKPQQAKRSSWDLPVSLDDLPAELRAMNPRDAKDWIGVLKSVSDIRRREMDLVSRAEALQMLVQRAAALKTGILRVPRRMQRWLDPEGRRALDQMLRDLLREYARPEGFVDELAAKGAATDAGGGTVDLDAG